MCVWTYIDKNWRGDCMSNCEWLWAKMWKTAIWTELMSVNKVVAGVVQFCFIQYNAKSLVCNGYRFILRFHMWHSAQICSKRVQNDSKKNGRKYKVVKSWQNRNPSWIGSWGSWISYLNMFWHVWSDSWVIWSTCCKAKRRLNTNVCNVATKATKLVRSERCQVQTIKYWISHAVGYRNKSAW